MVIAKWESRNGAHWVELQCGAGRYSYVGNGCGGIIGPVASVQAAVLNLQAKVDSGYFLPDNAKLPMVRVR